MAARPSRALRTTLFAAVALSTSLAAQQLPFRRYGVAEGLPHTLVNAILQDAKGFLWLGTAAGLCRFDGDRFVTFDTRDGLPHPFVNGIAEDAAGAIWVATNGGGVARLGAEDPPRFDSFRLDARAAAQRVNSLAFDPEGRLWCATDAGLYRGERAADGAMRFTAAVSHRETSEIMTALRDGDGSLWFGILHELVHVKEGQVSRFPTPPGPEQEEITGLVRDARGRLLVGFGRSVAELREGRFEPVSLPFALAPGQKLYQMLAGPGDALWFATRRGLVVWRAAGATTYGSVNGLGTDSLFSLARDREGQLWIGTQNAGLVKLSSDAVERYTTREGLPEDLVTHVVLPAAEPAVASLSSAGLARIDGGRALPVPGSGSAPFHHVGSRLWRESAGEGRWWIGTDGALFRTEGSALRLDRVRKITAPDGSDIRLTESPVHVAPDGAAWAGARDGTLWRFAPGAPPEAFVRVAPTRTGDIPGPLLVTRAGTLWATTAASRVGRVSAGVISPLPGFPDALVRALFQDRRGRLWIGFRYGGLWMTEEPEAARPRFTHRGRVEGLASDTILSLADDDAGRIWIGGERGLDRLDPATGRIRHFTTAEGMPEARVVELVPEPSGVLWAATYAGLVRLDCGSLEGPSVPPSVFLRRVSVADEARPRLADGSARSLSLSFPPLPSLSIAWTGIGFASEGALRYRYILEGADRRWGAPTRDRSVSYVRLPAGRYRFLVRALAPDGTESPEPAALSFVVPPPVWKRPWFLAGIGLLVASSAFAAHRARVARLLELERVRTRIAADLHDDVGSSLSRIAVLSEAARRSGRPVDPEVGDRLERIAGISRELLDATGDIVWAVNPARDRLSDLSQRMRRFAEDLLEGAGVALTMELPAPDEDAPLSAEVRRETLLIFKESVHNVLRHAAAKHVAVRMSRRDGHLLLSVRDDGRGFSPSAPREGNGLASMRRRAARLGGTLAIASGEGTGTSLELDVPLHPRASRRRDGTGSTPGDAPPEQG